MPAVLVHGNPETAAIWTPLIDALAARGVSDVQRLSPPGFGVPAPADWPATMTAYRDWLIAELERFDEPVDLVGHDWGAGHLYGLLAERPELVRTWAADCAGLLHPDYRWHWFAWLWQTRGVGELLAFAMTRQPLVFRALSLRMLGMPPDIAREVAVGQNAEMGRCILPLYRTGAQPALREVGLRLDGAELPKGLVLIPTHDPYPGTPEMAAEMAEKLGASQVRLEGFEHWWMFGDGAEQAADALIAHW